MPLNSSFNKDSQHLRADKDIPAAKVIGMIAGVGWPSTVEAYKTINAEANKRLGGDNTVNIALWSINEGAAEKHLMQGNWPGVAQYLIEAAQAVERAGADFIYMPCNTYHRVAAEIAESVSIPFIHMVDSVGKDLQRHGINKVALLGTKFTMNLDFYKGKLDRDYNIDVLVPDEGGQDIIHDIIFTELLKNDIRDESRHKYMQVIERLKERGAQGVVLGCTEIGLLVQQNHMPDLPMFDSTVIHSLRALDVAMGREKIDFTPRMRKHANFNNDPAQRKALVHG